VKRGEVLASGETVEQRVHGKEMERTWKAGRGEKRTGALRKVVYNTH